MYITHGTSQVNMYSSQPSPIKNHTTDFQIETVMQNKNPHHHLDKIPDKIQLISNLLCRQIWFYLEYTLEMAESFLICPARSQYFRHINRLWTLSHKYNLCTTMKAVMQQVNIWKYVRTVHEYDCMYAETFRVCLFCVSH